MAAAAEQLGAGVSVFAAMPGGPELAAVLAGIDPGQVDRVAGVEVLAAARRVESWAAATAARAAAALSRGTELFDHPEEKPATLNSRARVDPTAEEVAMRLALTRREAATLVRVGRGLGAEFEDTGRALATGEVDYRKAATIVTTLDSSPTAVGWMVEQDVLPAASGRTVPQLREDLQQRLLEVDPEEAQRRHDRARSRRRVTRPRVLADGMGSISAVLPAEDCVQLDQSLTAAAQSARASGDARTSDQLRADVLLAMTHAAILTGDTGPHADPATIAGLEEVSTEACTGPACQPSAPDHPGSSRADEPATGGGTADTTAHGDGERPAGEPSAAEAQARNGAAADGAWEADNETDSDEPTAGTVTALHASRLTHAEAESTRSTARDEPEGQAGPHERKGDSPPDADASTGEYGATTTDHDRDAGSGDRSEERPGPPGRAIPAELYTGRRKDRAGPPVQGRFPDLDSAVPEVAVISPLLAALLRRGSERLSITRPQIRVTVPLDVLLTAQARQAAQHNRDQQPARETRDSTPDPADTTLPTTTGTTLPTTDETTLPSTDEMQTPPQEDFDDTAQPAAVLAGYGAITADQAVTLAAYGNLRRLVTDPLTGAPVDLGRTRYRPPAALQELVRLRDRTCVRPGCTVAAQDCQIDHTESWASGGTTSSGNNGPMCTRDHLLKTVGAFHVTQPEDGIFVWTTPTGHTYRRDRDGTITLTKITTPPSFPARHNGSPGTPASPASPATFRADDTDDPPPF
ncbi:hypothetical protein GCM10023169_18540 [Georgenia halophila]|uniref:DUF222 domain-containing protein n=2 Tax=Georgenia halophila TaxID=620889 RepID=A0ABP8L5H2_9MICO